MTYEQHKAMLHARIDALVAELDHLPPWDNGQTQYDLIDICGKMLTQLYWRQHGKPEPSPHVSPPLPAIKQQFEQAPVETAVRFLGVGAIGLVLLVPALVMALLVALSVFGSPIN